MILSGSKCHEF